MTIQNDSLLFEKSSLPNFRLVIKIPNTSPKKAPREIPMANPKLPRKSEKQMPARILAVKEKKSIKNARLEYP